MRRLLPALAGVFFAALITFPEPGRAADSTLTGTWKTVIMNVQGDTIYYFVSLEEKGERLEAKVVSSHPALKDAKPTAKRLEGGRISLKLEAKAITLHFVVAPPKEKSQQMIGHVEVRGQQTFAMLMRTEDKELTQQGSMIPREGFNSLASAMREKDAAKKVEGLKEVAEKEKESLIGHQARLNLLGLLPGQGAQPEELKATAEATLSFAGGFSPEMRREALGQVAQSLVTSKKATSLAVDYARQAEKALTKDATLTQQIAVLKILESALKQQLDSATDKPAVQTAVKEVTERVARIDGLLDAEYLKTAIPFPTEPYTASKKGGRVALVELFTGAQCPPCVAADVAFDAALKTYKAEDVVLLQYHLHIPGPDVLTNEDTESRQKYYSLRGVPSTYLNGGQNLPLGGSKDNAKGAFEKMTEALTKAFEQAPSGKITLTAVRKGDQVSISTEVSEVKNAGESLKLRVALVEEMVRYPGSNGQRFHHHVVRTMPGGAEGIKVEGATLKKDFSVDLAVLRKSLSDYLTKANEKRPFRESDRPLDLKDLKVVAFLQDDSSKEVLQAIQVDVREVK